MSRDLGGTPAAAPLNAMVGPTRTLRDQIAAQQSRQSAAANARPVPAPVPDRMAGPYTDFEYLGQRVVSAMTNPLQRETFRASLAQGIDFNVGVSAIEPSPSGWLVQLSGRLGVSGTPGQGFFCRVDRNDSASVAVLRTVTPPYGIIHVTAPNAESFLMESRPLQARIVFGPCTVTTPSERSSGRPSTELGRTPSSPSVAPHGAIRGPQYEEEEDTGEPVALSPPDLSCTSNPLRRKPERAMAHRLRQAWAIPEALRADPSLVLTFAVTLNLDAQLTAPPQLTRSQSQRATPEQLKAAVEAAHRAIQDTAPFPELGQLAGGTMQVDMTPCD